MVGRRRTPRPRRRGPSDLYRVGVAGTVARMIKVPDGTLRILVQGAAARAARATSWPPSRTSSRASRRSPTSSSRAPSSRRSRATSSDLQPDHRAGAVPARGAEDRGREPRRPGRARAHDRRRAADQDRGAPGAARGARPGQAAAAAARAAHARVGADLARDAHPVADPVRDGHRPARVLPAPAAQGDPGGAGRGGRAGGGGRASCASSSRRRSCPRGAARRPSASWRGSSGCRRRPPSTA